MRPSVPIAASAGWLLVVTLSCRSTSSVGGSTSSPCDDYFDAVDGSGCAPGPTLPDSELTRLRGRFEAVCQAGLALPGSGMTSALLEACATAITAGGCAAPEPAVCAMVGSLPAGTTCNEGFQCASGACFQGAIVGEGGPPSTTCGQCQPVAELGQPCSGLCVAGATCDHAASTPTCVSVSAGAAGAECDGVANVCAPGLYCSSASTCTPLPATGQPCTTDGQCVSADTCVGQTCEALGSVGAACGDDADCVPGLGCSQVSATCGPVTWGSAGQACGDLTRCLVGDCATDTMTCPSILGDGQACAVDDASTTCDTFAQCLEGTCVLQDSNVCM